MNSPSKGVTMKQGSMTRLLLAMIGLVLASCAPSDRDLLAGPNAVQRLADGRSVDIPPTLAELQRIGSTRFDLVLPGRRASFRVSGATWTFLSIYASPEIKLFRLRPGVEDDDRNLKVRVVSAGAFSIPRFEIPSDVAVELQTSREGDGLYRVTLIGPLPPGEYAFLSQVDLDRWQEYPYRGVRTYAFGVD